MEDQKWRIYVPEMIPPAEPQMEILSPLGEIETGESRGEADLIARAGRADALLLSIKTRMTRKVMAACPKLKVISKYGVGVENIDVAAATELGIPVFNTPGSTANSTAELVIGLMLSALRRIHLAKDYIAGGRWRDETFLGDELFRSQIGIIGYGDVAKRVIRKLQGFEVGKFLVFTETKGQEKPEFPNVTFTGLSDLLQNSDIVSIHKALTPKSKGLIGRREIGLLKKTAYLINASRGSLLDESALIEALREKRIAGAALDVFEQEPLPPDHPFLSLNNVAVTPHIGGSTRQTRIITVTAAARNLADFLLGKRIEPRYLVNPKAYKPPE